MMKNRNHLLSLVPMLALVILVGSPAGQARSIEDETYAQLLLAHPAEAGGETDTVMTSWLDLIESEPDHPLTAAALRLVQLRLNDLADPGPISSRILAVDGSSMDPAARRRLDLLVAWTRRARLPVEQLASTDLYPEHLKNFLVLGPLGPLGHPDALLDHQELMRNPGFERSHPTLDGATPWRTGDRTRTNRFVQPQRINHPGHGYALVGTRFDLPTDLARGGAGYLEIDHGSTIPDDRARSGDPSYAFSLNGEEPLRVDLMQQDRAAVARFPVAYRAGRNQLVLCCRIDSGIGFAIRILGADGRAYRGLVETPDAQPLGPPADPGAVDQLPEFRTEESHLLELATRGPFAEALLGVLQLENHRAAEGLARLRAATSREPGSIALKALLARSVAGATYLPEAWRRNRARELATEVVASRPDRVDMALHLANLLAEEDREEEAIEMLRRLSDRRPHQVGSVMALSRVYHRLEMTAQSEAALLEAQQRAPRHPHVLAALASLWERVGQPSRAIEMRRRELESGGRTVARLRNLAKAYHQTGRVEEAEACYREANARAGDPNDARDLASFLSDIDRLDQADELFARVAKVYPRWIGAPMERAGLAVLRGDVAAETAHLRRALELAPSWRPARERLRELTGEDPTGAFVSQHLADRQEALASYEDGKYDDSVVRLLKSAVINLFPDGTSEVLLHDLLQVRDLEGCESQGKRKLKGEVLRIVTLKPGANGDETEYEPVKVDGEYVMPSLEPGDFVEVISRNRFDSPGNGVIRISPWTLSSSGQPYLRTHYVVRVPDELNARLVKRQFDGTHDVIKAEGATVHVIRSRDRARIRPEQGTPPWTWYLPWVQIGSDQDPEAGFAMLRQETMLPVRVTPEVEQAARTAIEGVEGEEQRAKALLALVNSTLDQRWPQWNRSATDALLSREGNPTALYAALLEAADIDYELIWTRNLMPGAEIDPDPAFRDVRWWRRKLLIRVLPEGGPAAWCDLSSRELPYGSLTGDAPGAPSWSVQSGAFLTLPEAPLEDLPGVHIELDFSIGPKGGAIVEGRARLGAGLGFALKTPLKEVPKVQRKFLINALASRVVPGIDVNSYQLTGLEEDELPLSGVVRGGVREFLDEAGGRLVCQLPISKLQLSATFSDQGERSLPFQLRQPLIQSTRATLVLPDEIRLVSPPRGLRRSFQGGRYLLSVEPDGAGRWLIRQEIFLPPFSLAAGEFADFQQLCREIDEVERAQLQFERN